MKSINAVTQQKSLKDLKLMLLVAVKQVMHIHVYTQIIHINYTQRANSHNSNYNKIIMLTEHCLNLSPTHCSFISLHMFTVDETFSV